ncbi:MAG TPA: excinuclease ABC subunit UvrC [Candidatus Saccharimonadales bacterium]|nr:excinuclease ABC subunit UvrC [Candidatus Saccharimonadales bacterium]
MVSKRIAQKLSQLPKDPGVYFHKDSKGEIIYVGKAALLHNRVRQYFHKSRLNDPKTEALISEIYDIDWMVVDSELEALFLEAEMIRRYMPRYNILLRDDKALSYIRIDYDSDYPTVTTSRRPLDDGARYFGPYQSTLAVSQSLRLLRRIFPFAIKRQSGQQRANLYYHLGLDPGLEEGKTDLAAYRANLRKLITVIQGKRRNIVKELERDMKHASKNSEFELAAKLRNQLFALRSLDKQVIFSDKEFLDISKDHALGELVNMLSIVKFPRRIEGYDISHQQGSDVVASMVVFTNGVSNKAEYRKFKTKFNRNDDFYNMNETIKRRFSVKNSKLWSLPDLVLIDGGKGQLDAAIKARDEQGFTGIPFIGLAKRDEQLVIHKSASNVTLNTLSLNKIGGFTSESEEFIVVNLPHNTNLVKLLQRIRDESHRFAVSYHSVLKVKRQTASLLDDVPGIGPLTRKKLLRNFGSLRTITKASEAELGEVIGVQKAKTLSQYIHAD